MQSSPTEFFGWDNCRSMLAILPSPGDHPADALESRKILMTIYSKSAMTRPLFEEPTADIERADPWTGPQGFVFGGMGDAQAYELAQDYFEAAHVIVEAIKRGDWEDYRLAHPVLFLYRHSIELFLKGLMDDGQKTHRLAELADDFANFVKRNYNEVVPAWIIARLKEIAKIDPNSTAFRYSRNFDPVAKRDIRIPGEIYISLPHLQQSMMALLHALAGVLGPPVADRMEEVVRRHLPYGDWDL